MKILIIGGNGKIGSQVAKHLAHNHNVITASRNSGEVRVDIRDSKSIQEMFEQVGILDAIVSIAGEAKWDNFSLLNEDDYFIGLRSKLMGQVNIARIGQNYLSPNGSITLSTGILADDPVIKTASAAMVNGAIHSFVKAVALELEKGIRINAVSLGLVEDSYEKYKDFFPGHIPIPMFKVINAYIRSVFGRNNGEIIKVYN